MRCPSCKSDFALGWRLYFRRNPYRLECPTCGAGHRFAHGWAYYLLTPLYVWAVFLGIMFAALPMIGITWALAIAALIGLPTILFVDRYLDSRFAVLTQEATGESVPSEIWGRRDRPVAKLVVLVLLAMLIPAGIWASLRLGGWEGEYGKRDVPSGEVVPLGRSGAVVTIPSGWRARRVSQLDLPAWLGFGIHLAPHYMELHPDPEDGRELSASWGSRVADWSSTRRSRTLIHVEPNAELKAANVRIMFLNRPPQANWARAGFTDAFLLVDNPTGRYSLTVRVKAAPGDVRAADVSAALRDAGFTFPR